MTGKNLKKDLQDIISDVNIPWDIMKNCVFLVTGATGLIGGILVRTLLAANEKFDLNLRIMASGRNKNRIETLSLACNTIKWICGDIRRADLFVNTGEKIDFIFHCAAITQSADMVARPVDVMTTSVDGTCNVLAVAKTRNCRSFVYLSSMEVYGQDLSGEVTERDLGYVELSNPRSSYPESKRFCEMLCIAYAVQYGLPVKIARLARTFGAGTSNDVSDLRVASQFARKAMHGENIELHTQGYSIANCCYTSDAIRGLFTLLLKGKNGEAYNIANPAACTTVREMANIVASEVCGGRIKVIVRAPENISKLGYNADLGYTLNVQKLCSLGWKPTYGLADMFKRMMDDWRNENR